jgi:Ohr subfamily peroxiredoxin
MNALYKTSAVSRGGRDGTVSVQNSSLMFDMAAPAELGGMKTGVNPEQLFAAGYSACFGSAVQHVIRTRRVVADPPEVKITVGLGKNDAGGFQLSADILVTFTGLSPETADIIAKEAHEVCPYSNAIRGNVEVTLKAEVK